METLAQLDIAVIVFTTAEEGHDNLQTTHLYGGQNMSDEEIIQAMRGGRGDDVDVISIVR